MVSFPQSRAAKPEEIRSRLRFQHDDAASAEYPQGHFDLVHSRDVILHIKDKEKLFSRLFAALKPGGTIMITDYCKGEVDKLSQDFLSYASGFGYHFLTSKEYEQHLMGAGFVQVKSKDVTEDLIRLTAEDVTRFPQIGAELGSDSDPEMARDLAVIEDAWRRRNERCRAREQLWVHITAKKPEKDD